MSNHKKVALDSSAKDYWKFLYGEYGEDLVRDIPRRIKAALQTNRKTASVGNDATVTPVAHARSADGMLVEGIYTDDSQRLIFRATVSQSGDVSDVQAIEVR